MKSLRHNFPMFDTDLLRKIQLIWNPISHAVTQGDKRQFCCFAAVLLL